MDYPLERTWPAGDRHAGMSYSNRNSDTPSAVALVCHVAIPGEP